MNNTKVGHTSHLSHPVNTTYGTPSPLTESCQNQRTPMKWQKRQSRRPRRYHGATQGHQFPGRARDSHRLRVTATRFQAAALRLSEKCLHFVKAPQPEAESFCESEGRSLLSSVDNKQRKDPAGLRVWTLKQEGGRWWGWGSLTVSPSGDLCVSASDRGLARVQGAQTSSWGTSELGGY